MSTPIPEGRGRWRFTLHQRPFTGTTWQGTLITELTDVYQRKLTKKLNSAAELTFAIDGESTQAELIVELATEVIAWRWDEALGEDVPMFRGPVDSAQDECDEDSITSTFTCHDYFAMFGRRIVTQTYSETARDQDAIVADLVYLARNEEASDATSFAPGTWLPLGWTYCDPDGSARVTASTQLRDRTYEPSTKLDQAISDLAAVINGFDFDVLPLGWVASDDQLRVFYPYQGVERPDCPLVYGTTLTKFTRTVDSGDYANYVRMLGSNGGSGPQKFSEAWAPEANDVTVNPVGLWMTAENAADVTIQNTLDDQVQGSLDLHSQLIPSYTVTLIPDQYTYGCPNMGDVCPLIIRKGRLDVNTTIRILGISYDIGDDGEEDVALTLGRPTKTLAQILTRPDRDIGALIRR